MTTVGELLGLEGIPVVGERGGGGDCEVCYL